MGELITSLKFAEISSIVFSGVFLPEQIEKLGIKNFNKVNRFGEYFYIRNYDFKLQENDIIFTRIEDLNILFNILKAIPLKNVKIICHQSDLSISKKLYKSKPKCISKIYSVNVSHIASDLIPIPIGLANLHKKNLNESSFSEVKNVKQNYLNINKRQHLLFINFQISTNYKKRQGIYELYENQDWTKVEPPNLNKNKYSRILKDSLFTLAPFGNGVDTHRFWESLYSGSVPVVEHHVTYSYANELPVLFVKNIKKIDKNILNNYIDNFKITDFKFEKLYFDYWKSLILKDCIEEGEVFKIKTNGLKIKYFEKRYEVLFWLNNKLKIINFYLFRINKIFKNR